MRVSKNFVLQEFVDQKTFRIFGDASIWFVDPKIFELAQFYKIFLSKHYGQEVTVIINDWLWGGSRQYSGFRPLGCTQGSDYSQHRFGRAFDAQFKIDGSYVDCDEIRSIILANESAFMKKGLTTIEDGNFSPTWVHSDIRPTRLNQIKIVKPKK